MGQTGVSVVIRADSSATLGGGHVARCRNLAVELQRLGAAVRFLSASLAGSTAASITAGGFPVNWLPAAVQDDASLDARLSLQSLAGEPCEWLIVDHYGLARGWEAALRAGARRILVIDDLGDRPHDCDVLLDQNLFGNPAARYANLLPAQAVGLFGPRYSLLSDAFTALHGRAWERRRAAHAARRLLVFFGSADSLNLTERVLVEIAPLCRAQDLEVTAVLSSGAPHLGTARVCAARLGMTLLVDTDMAGLLADADVALGAGGTTNWERCAVGVPSIVCAVAANQVAVCESLAAAGMVRYLGWHADVQPGDWLRALHALLDDPGGRLALSERSLQCVDGQGARRVARELLGEMALRLRPARASDCMDVLAWRNDAGTRRHALESGSIDPDAHSRWFHAAIASANRALLIAESGAAPVGVLRYDWRDDDEAVISVYLVPAERGCGWGPALLRAGSHWLHQHRPTVRRVRATILQANTASVSAFLRAGYRRLPDGDFLLELDSG